MVVELNNSSDLILKTANQLALYSGVLGAVGMFIVANFQETAVIQIHLFGAFLCFGSGCVYMLIMTWIAYRMHPLFSGLNIAHTRFAIAFGATICFFTGCSLPFINAGVYYCLPPYSFIKSKRSKNTQRPFSD